MVNIVNISMSFSRLPYDTCAYKHSLYESIGAGEYMLDNNNVCSPCFVPSPTVNLQRFGASLCDKRLIDVDSELLGLNVRQSKCPEQNYIPGAKSVCDKYTHLKECNDLDTEPTRLSNPPCTLRSRGWNRWEDLCQNPQDNALMRFEHNISNRLVVKDTFRPLVPKPLDSTLALPKIQQEKEAKPVFCGIQGDPHPLNYRKCGELKKY
jgi:hypothetical protein